MRQGIGPRLAAASMTPVRNPYLGGSFPDINRTLFFLIGTLP